MRYTKEFHIENLTLEPASLGRRTGAALIDLLVLYALLWVPFVNFAFMLGYGLTRDSWKRLGGKSLGKRVFGLRVISLMSKHDIKEDYVTDITRNLYLLLAFIDFLTMPFSKTKRRFGDKKAKTLVVRENKVLTEYLRHVHRNSNRYVNPVDHYDSYKAF